MLSLGVYRPDWASRRFDSRPSAGWHRVDASRRWHLYQVSGLTSWQGDGVRVHRACDDAIVDVERRPRLKHGDEIEPAPGDAVCAACWCSWEAVLAMPTCGSYSWASYNAAPNPSQAPQILSEAPWRPQHMPAGPPAPALTCGGGWT